MRTDIVCSVCGEKCELKLVTITLPRSNIGLAVFRNVPAEVCPHCGEMQFSLLTTGQMMSVVQNSAPPDEFTMVPIYDMKRAAG